jgi:hypothetical protein
MKRQFPGLYQQHEPVSPPEGWFRVRIVRASYVRRAKPFYEIRFRILEPAAQAGDSFTGRLYCTTKALWKLLWFLQAFGYNLEMLHKDEVNDHALIGLSGVVRVSHTRIDTRSFLNLDAFEPEMRWVEFAPRLIAGAS